MARAFVTSAPTSELYLIQGEQPDTRDVEDARQWVTIYRELATFAERTLNRLRSGEGNGQAVALSHAAGQPRLGRTGALRRAASNLRRPPASSPCDRQGACPPGERAAPRLRPGLHRMSALQPGNVLPLRPPRPSAADERASNAARAIRTKLSLLEGYADIMEGLSTDLKVQILGAMAEKTRELSTALQPFVDHRVERRPAISDYRMVRSRTRQLITDYRVLLARLHQTMAQTGEPETKESLKIGRAHV